MQSRNKTGYLQLLEKPISSLTYVCEFDFKIRGDLKYRKACFSADPDAHTKPTFISMMDHMVIGAAS